MEKKAKPIKLSEVKPALLFLFAIALLIFLALLSFQKMSSVKQTSTEIEQNWLPSTRLLGKINLNTVEYRLTEMEHVLSLKEGEMRHYEEHMDSLLQLLNDNRSKYESLISSEAEQSLYKKFSSDWENYLIVSQESIALSRKNLNREATENLRHASQKLYSNMSKTLDELIELNVHSAKKVGEHGSRVRSGFIEALVVIGLLGAMALAMFIYDLSKKLR